MIFLKFRYNILSFYIILLCNFNTSAQYISTTKKADSITVKEGSYIIINNVLTFIKSDTTFFYNDSIEFNNNSYIKSEKFYNNIHQKASQTKITNEIYHLVFTPPNNHIEDKQIHIKSETPFLKYEDKIINKISIKKLDVFGPLVTDTTLKAKTWTGNTANKLHINTRTRIIKNNLLIKKGELVNPYVFADNERILRDLPYIKDARLYLKINPLDTNLVDVDVIVKDVWSIGVEGKVKDISSVSFDIFDKNILGLGHLQENNIIYDRNYKSYLGYSGEYKIYNISGSFINSNIKYANINDREIIRVKFNRNFITSEMKYAGGYVFQNAEWNAINPIDSTCVFKINNNYQDLWLGRSFKLIKTSTKSHYRTRLIFAGRLTLNNYKFDNQISNNSLLNLYDYSRLLFSLGISKQNYYKSFMIYSFGKTEDIPYGNLIELISGIEKKENKNRLYTGIALSKSNSIQNLGYYYSKFSAGSYLYKGKHEQGIIRLDFLYFTKLFDIFNYKSRQFVKINYTSGYNRNTSENININNGNGLRNYSLSNLNGNKRLTMNIENVLFTPLFVYGFKFALFGFADIGVLGEKNNFFYTNKYYSGLGLGLRIRNENLIFKTFEIKFIYYNTAPTNGTNNMLFFSNEQSYKFGNFNINTPNIFEFN
ncbi:MAG: hypothetical protein KAT68_16820 [Bacteroidales bacterium]|nr:hypothetical protein [Bacteroidales bacterium]